MIKIDNPATADGRRYGMIVKADFEEARQRLTPETMLDWVTLALQSHNFEWRHPEEISNKGFRELRNAGYISQYGEMDWVFKASGNAQDRSTTRDRERPQEDSRYAPPPPRRTGPPPQNCHQSQNVYCEQTNDHSYYNGFTEMQLVEEGVEEGVPF